MTKYAYFDSAVSSPSPVIGWYDTEQFEYPHLPEEKNLLAVDESQWLMHYNDPHGFAVSNGQLVTHPPATP